MKVVVPRNAIKWHRAGYAVGFLCRSKSGSSGSVPFYQTALYLCVNLRKLNWQKMTTYICFLIDFSISTGRLFLLQLDYKRSRVNHEPSSANNK